MRDSHPIDYEKYPDEIRSYVVRNNLEAVKAVLKKHPHCANSIYENQTLFDHPCRHGKVEMVNLLIQCGALVNNCNKIGSPPIVNAIVYNNFEIVKILCQNKAKVEGITVYDNVTMIDLAIMHGRYDSASYIYNLISNKTLKTVQEYEVLARKYFLRYVNYPVFIQGLIAGKSINEMEDFLSKPTPKENEEEVETCGWCCCFFPRKEASQEIESPEKIKETERQRLSKERQASNKQDVI